MDRGLGKAKFEGESNSQPGEQIAARKSDAQTTESEQSKKARKRGRRRSLHGQLHNKRTWLHRETALLSAWESASERASANGTLNEAPGDSQCP